MMTKTNILIRFSSYLALVFFTTATMAGEYTNSFHIKVDENDAVGESIKGDPVEAFNNAIEAAMKTGQSLGESELINQSRVEDFVLKESWVQKEAHMQITDLQVLKYKFSQPVGEPIRVNMRVDMKVDYVDVPKFMDDYEKTVTGATYRSMAIPGWGQFYNRQNVTGILYGVAFWTFYIMFIGASDRAGTNNTDLTNAAINFQLPALILWSFNVSEAAVSRHMGKQGLNNLARAYRMDPKFEYEPINERGFKMDFLLWTWTF